MVALRSRNRRPYKRTFFREETMKLVEESFLDENANEALLESVEPYIVVSEKTSTEQDVAYPFHFQGSTLVIGKDKKEKLKHRLMTAIQKGAEATNPKERRYWHNELMRAARKLKRFNYFPPRNMLLWSFYFQGERLRFGRPYEYGTQPTKYDKFAPYTREYAPTVSKEKRSPFADFALHFPEYRLLAIISKN